LYWRWKSRPRGGRPTVPLEVRRLIREMSITNPLWGAPRIHGELLKLDIAIGQTSVAKYMAKRRGPPSQGWKTFLRFPISRSEQRQRHDPRSQIINGLTDQFTTATASISTSHSGNTMVVTKLVNDVCLMMTIRD